MNLKDTMIVGAQYYRPPNPPRADWEQDLRRMADTGMNTVKLWACWSWMNAKKGQIDFGDLDELMDIAHSVGLRVVINTILEDAPYWLEAENPDARYVDHEGNQIYLTAAMNTPGGGWPGLCFNAPAVMDAAMAFLTAVVSRYADHPALFTWDVWNEPHLEPASYFPDRMYSYDAASIGLFRDWLKQKYASIDHLNDAWARRFSDWAQVEPPRLFEALPDMMDWRAFWFDTLRGWLSKRVETARAADAQHPIMTHVALSGFTGQLATHTLDEFTLTDDIDGFGTSSFPTWLMAEDPVEHLMNLDTARAAAGDKPFWQTELQGGRGRRDGTRSTPQPKPENVQMEMWNAMAAGARGTLFWQWRPELLGPESPGYGLCAPDGSPTGRSDAAGQFAAMVARHPELKDLKPVTPSIGLFVSRKSAIHCFGTDRNIDIYKQAVMGAYRLFLDADIPVEFVHEDQIDKSGVPEGIQSLYLPMPAALSDQTVSGLCGWVRNGGNLITEAAPGEYTELGWHRGSVPPAQLREVLGLYSHETDAISHSAEFDVNGFMAQGAWLKDHLILQGAKEIGQFTDGATAAALNIVGTGSAITIATCPSVQYFTGKDADTRAAISALISMDQHHIVTPQSPCPGVMRRPQSLNGKSAELVLNWSDQPQRINVVEASQMIDLNGSKAAAGEEVLPAKTAALFVAAGD